MKKIIFLILISLLITACIDLDVAPEDIDQDFYSLDIIREEEIYQPYPNSHLMINPLRIAESFHSKTFIYQVDYNKFINDFYHQFFIYPHTNISEEVYEWLYDSKLFTHISQVNHVDIPINYILEGKIHKLYGEYISQYSAYAVMNIQFILFKEKNLQTELIFEATYEEKIRISRKNQADSLVYGWNTALEKIMLRFESDLIKNLQ